MPKSCQLMVLCLLAGCDAWPRYNNLPEGDTDALPSSVDPRLLFSVTWTEQDEQEPNDSPDEAEQISLTATNVGAVYQATAEGIGWASGMNPEVVESEECGSSGELTAGVDPGSWLGDVDTYRVTMTRSGVLCARAVVDDPEASTIGWDLLLFQLDACGVPLAAMYEGDGDVVGFGDGGAEGGWRLELDAGTYLALFAPYSPDDLDRSFDYRIGFSLLELHEGDEPLCPLLPDEDGA